MTSFDYNYQNPLGFRFLVQITPFVLDTPLGLQNLNKKRKTKWILVDVVKLRHREICLFMYPRQSYRDLMARHRCPQNSLINEVKLAFFSESLASVPAPFY